MVGKNRENRKEIEKISNTSISIGKGSTITGSIDALGNVRIDGTLSGNIYSQSKVATGTESRVEGMIQSQNAEIEGYVKGTLQIEDVLILRATAYVEGDIITNKLVVEAGAQFNGKCNMGLDDRSSFLSLEDISINERKQRAVFEEN